jgi:hypothetical protein
MVCLQTQNPNLGKFGKALDWKMLIYFVAILNILRTLGIFCDHFVQFVLIWYIFTSFGIMHQEKSGNPADDCARFLANLFSFSFQLKSLPRSSAASLDFCSIKYECYYHIFLTSKYAFTHKANIHNFGSKFHCRHPNYRPLKCRRKDGKCLLHLTLSRQPPAGQHILD